MAAQEVSAAVALAVEEERLKKRQEQARAVQDEQAKMFHENQAAEEGLKSGLNARAGMLASAGLVLELDISAARETIAAQEALVEVEKRKAAEAAIAAAEKVLKEQKSFGCRYADWVLETAAKLPLDLKVRPEQVKSQEAASAKMPFFIGRTGYITVTEGGGGDAYGAKESRRFYDSCGRLCFVLPCAAAAGEARLVFQRDVGRWVGAQAWRTGLVSDNLFTLQLDVR